MSSQKPNLTENEMSESVSDDPWEILADDNTDSGWSELSSGEKIKYVIAVVIKIILLLIFVYFFICALGFLHDAFQLLGGETAGRVFQESHLLSNPVAGLMIGILATAIIQSSSTTISIVITMAGAGIIPVRYTIPIVMGANIGTTVTNTIVSLVQIQDRSIFRRAFGGATIHDVFNCLTVLVLLPVEVISGYLYQLTKAIVSTIETDGDADTKRDILKKVTKPFIKLFVEIDKKIIKDLAKSKEIDDSATLLKRWCKYTSATVTEVKDVFEVHSKESLNNSYVDKLLRSRMNFTMTDNEQNVTLHWNQLFSRNISIPTKRCSNLFAMTNLSDDVVGTIILFVSMLLIIICLVLVVKILNSLFKGAIARVVKKFMNSDFPGRMAWLTGYIAILIGTGLTMVIQSSSILTSTLTPLVGVGLLSLDRMLPLTIGANIGTTLTGILAALAVPASRIPYTLQVALCHLFFNISGALLFYPVPVLRRIPIQLAKMLGTVTAKYRWFSIIYLILVFFGIPAFVFGLSIAGDDVIMAVGIPILTLLIFIVILNTMQNICPNALPKKLQNWKFLPIWFRSLEPYDKMLCCCFNNDTVKKSILKQKGTIELKSHCHDNKAFDLVNP